MAARAQACSTSVLHHWKSQDDMDEPEFGEMLVLVHQILYFIAPKQRWEQDVGAGPQHVVHREGRKEGRADHHGDS